MKRTGNFLCVLPIVMMLGIFGYSHKAPSVGEIKSIYIKTIENKINIGAEISERSGYKTYRPGLEIEATKVIINRFLYDGGIKVVSSEKEADAKLLGELVDYNRQALRYSSEQTIEEFRVNVTVNFKLIDMRSEEKKVLWEGSLSGDSSQVTAGRFSKTETQAVDDALVDLARRVIERTFQEDW
ncbi:MAG: LPS assembly lipoprotein LptE [Candidatus Omnitrophota bacterium]